MQSTEWPRLHDFGADLLVVSRRDRAVVLGRPLVMMAAYVALALNHHWILAALTVPVMYPMFVAVVHDLLHADLGLSSRANAAWLSFYGVLVLESGHAIQITHIAHHRRLATPDDPETYVGHMPLWRAALEGPIYPFRLWQWARAHHPERRRRIAAETFGHIAFGASAILLVPITPIPLVFVALMLGGLSIFPAISVNLLHDVDGETPFDRTFTSRGRFLPLITLGSAYHLEHHLYPSVSSAHYFELARRLRRFSEQRTPMIANERSRVIADEGARAGTTGSRPTV